MVPIFDFEVNREQAQIEVRRSFEAPLDLVWAAWTEPEILDLWWAPKPWRAETSSMDFRVGGRWLYCMVGPNQERQYCLLDYEAITPGVMFSGTDAFCDAAGQMNDSKPRASWKSEFSSLDAERTLVVVTMQFDSLTDLELIISMGFREGFTMGLGNLDEYIKAQFYLRRSKKTSFAPRVTGYVNFPGNTEEVFQFYRRVFRTEFVQGIQRFADIPPSPDAPVLPESIQQMVLHVELPLPGGFILMGTDAPKELGFELTSGNNMHFNLEPDSRAEAERLFNELSEGGTITMPLQDMFFGAYYGEFKDRYGINWMVTHHSR